MSKKKLFLTNFGADLSDILQDVSDKKTRAHFFNEYVKGGGLFYDCLREHPVILVGDYKITISPNDEKEE